MAESSEDPDQGTGSSTRVIAIAAVLAALLALVVALGLVLRANQGDENDPSTVDPMGTDSHGLPVGDEVSGQEAAFAPPWPARRVGGNCSAGGIVAHWRVETDGQWQCTVTTPDAAVPAAPAPPPPPAEPPPPEPAPVEAPPAFEPPPAYEPPVYEPPPPPEPEPIPVPAPAPPPPPPPPPVIQLPFPLPPIFVPPAAAVLP
ncbi:MULTISPECIES: hypothetical protein [Nocardia]|uniref:hypothetical protein n=3 Tax=Nocardiaceae TaxID=85025 RepID=UPI00292DBA95|nr:hypothetical protein [Nocardia canadensis]